MKSVPRSRARHENRRQFFYERCGLLKRACVRLLVKNCRGFWVAVVDLLPSLINRDRNEIGATIDINISNNNNVTSNGACAWAWAWAISSPTERYVGRGRVSVCVHCLPRL